jgi:hypothetical protein
LRDGAPPTFSDRMPARGGKDRAANGRELRGRSAPAIVYGFSKDHRPDLKQLLFILSVTDDGVRASFRCADGNTCSPDGAQGDFWCILLAEGWEHFGCHYNLSITGG